MCVVGGGGGVDDMSTLLRVATHFILAARLCNDVLLFALCVSSLTAGKYLIFRATDCLGAPATLCWSVGKRGGDGVLFVVARGFGEMIGCLAVAIFKPLTAPRDGC